MPLSREGGTTLKKYLPLLVAGAAILASTAHAARITVNPITHTPLKVYQAYAGNSLGTDLAFRGYLGTGVDVITAVPGVLSIDPGANWSNFVGAAQVPGGPSWSIKNVVLRKVTPTVLQCADRFPVKNIPQQGSANIRLWWPLQYELPGTVWTLTILYGTTTPYDDDGAGTNPAGYAHTEVWTWTVDADFAHLSYLLALFHEEPFGLDEVPLISDEVLYPKLQALVAKAAGELNQGDKVSAGLTLGELELTVMDACIGISPAFPNPTGPGTGIANTLENPACCKLLVDFEYIGKTTGIFVTAK